MKKLLLLLACSYCFVLSASAQGTLKGKLIDSTSKAPLAMATVTIFKAIDTTIITYRLSGSDGEFKVPGIPLNLKCRVVVSLSGYAVYRKEFTLTSEQNTLDINAVALTQATQSLDEVIVFAERPPVIIKKDTIEFNAASFKTLPNALVEDLLKKLPGVQVDADGNIVVNGKPVNKILVDGKSFFGDDPKMATRNLPANVIDKVQVTDDKEEMLRSGDDNPNNVGKVVNITLKKNIKKGWFGKLYAGGGTNNVYEAGGIANIYRDTLQISLLGYMNNMNKAGFSYSELMQAGGLERSRSNTGSNNTSIWRNSNGNSISINGVSFGGLQSFGGIATSKGFGFNLNHTPNKKRSFFLQYFKGNTSVDRENITNISQYNADTIVNSSTVVGGGVLTNAHNIGIGARLKPDSVTNILVNANYTIGLQNEQRLSDVNSLNNLLGPLSAGNIIQSNPSNTYYYRHNISITRLSKTKKGRRFNFNQSLDINNRFNDYRTESDLRYLYPVTYDSNYSQLRKERIPRTDASVYFNVSEPITKIISLRMGGRYEYSQLYNSVNTFNKNINTDKYDTLNDALSSRFKRIGNRFLLTPGLEFKWKNLTVTPGVKVLMQSFNNTLASLPAAIEQKRNDMLPMLSIVYKQLSFNYSKDISMPGYNYLIPVTDNTNPYFIVKGNAGLVPMDRNNFNLNYNFSNTKTNFYAYVYANGSFTKNDVVQSITVDDKGAQTSVPVNANGSKNFYLNFNVNQQYKNKQKFTFYWNIGGNYNYNRNKLIYNAKESWQSTFNLNNWVNFNFNFNDKVLWNNMVNKGYNFTSYTTSGFKKINVKYAWLTSELVVNLPKHFAWETQIAYDYNNSLLTKDTRNIVRWNAAVNYTMLKSETLVLRFSVFDILKTNKSVYAYVNRNMLTSVQTNVLAQYFMATVTYNVRPYGAKKKSDKDRLF